MKTQNIPSEQWGKFLDLFSRQHHGKPVTIQTLSRQFGAEVNARNLPLLGIVDQRASEFQDIRGGETIQIMAGTIGEQVGHAIDCPSQIKFAEWNDGYSAALEIQARDGSETIIQVGPAEELLPPGFVMDGTVMGQPAQG